MRRPTWRSARRWSAVSAVGLWLTLIAGRTFVWSAPPAVHLPATPPVIEATPAQDDAALHDVQLVGARLGWAVGDRGTVWRTVDGGQSWEFRSTPVIGSLRSVCFLSDQIGWAVGGEVAPYSRIAQGIVLGTTDGGQSWTVLARNGLPYLYHVSFFGLEEGIAVGSANNGFPTGVAVTRDGGKTWQPAPGSPSTGWRTAAFVDEETGALAGLRGQFATFAGGGVAERGGNPLGLRGVHAVDLQADGRGWLVGDGGLVLTTRTAGAGWSEPAGGLPAALRDCFDVRCVSGHGDRVWMAGAPGSAIWHSPDGGSRWESQPLADPTPLHAIDFSSPARGCAVGAFGRIVMTDDGGRTWSAARGDGRRAALLALHSSAERAPLRLLVRSSAEEGYRSVVQLTARHDIGPDGDRHTDADLRLQEAVVAAGGCDADIAWKLPLAAPGLDRDYGRLLEEWSQLTDGRLPDVLLKDLVAGLRMWRPSVIVIDEPGEHDAADRLLRQAILHAVADAADPRQFPEQQALMHLEPWQASRVYIRLPAGQTGEIVLDPHEIVPRQGRTLLMAAASATAVLGVENLPSADHFRMLLPEGSQAGGRGRSLFGGLALPAGGEARRELPALSDPDFDYEAMENLAQHQRNFAAWRDQALNNEAHAAQIIAQLNDVLEHAPTDQAALQLAALADAYLQHAQWQLAEEALIELAERYPNEPPAIDGMVRLLQMWTSQEVGWRRARGISASKNQVTVRGEVAQAVVNETQNLLGQQGGLERVKDLARSSASPLLIQPAAAEVSIGGREDQRRFDARRWHEQATTIAADLQKRAPAAFAVPDVQFVCAALYRQREMYQQSDAIYREFARIGDAAWQLAARGELWTLGTAPESPKPVLQCARAEAPPVLDGLLSDPCWRNATDLELTPEGADRELPDATFVGSRRTTPSPGRLNNGTGAIAMLAYDSKYLYFAASLPRFEGLADDPVQYAGRTHDAELLDFDRVALCIDTDRDYSTFYEFEVDSRGQTRDACWRDASWNPQWYVANDADTQRWTIEAAIPLEELTPLSSLAGQVWSIGIVRTMPTVGVESWTHPSGATPRPATFGLVRMR